MWRKPKIKWSV